MSNAFTDFFSKHPASSSEHTESKAQPHGPLSPVPMISTASTASSPISSPGSSGSDQRAASTQETILSRKAPSIHRGTKQKLSRKIQLTSNADTLAAVCDITGSVVSVTFPHIPGRVFSYISPLSILSNCRGIAQEGRDYMRKLDTDRKSVV